MCGIAGIVEFNQTGNREILETMGHILAHRGPDDYGIFKCNTRDFSIGLASRRLSIIDLSPAGHMPMSNFDEKVWITYNGEIYNHLDIRAEISKKNSINFKSRTDTETLLYAYEAYGLEAFKLLNGIFAVAIYDKRTQSLVLARDRMGVKPVYYYWDGTIFIFSSELKAMLAHPKINRRIDLNALDTYLAFGYVPSPYCLIENVRKLKPGHILVLRDHHLSLTPFWSPAFNIPKKDSRPFIELVEESHQTIDAAVKNQLMSDVPVGVMLSGGLDSTIVTAMAKKYHIEPLHTFSVGFETRRSVMEMAYNWDRDFARSVSHQLGTIHHEVVINDELGLIDQIERLICALDEPLWEPSYLSIYAMSVLANEQGIKVLLSGDGSDELYGGYPWYAGALQLARYDRIPFLGPFLDAGNAWLPEGTLRYKTTDLRNKYRQPNYIKYIYNYQHFNAEVRACLLSNHRNENGVCLSDFIQSVLGPFRKASIADQFAFADLMLWVREHFNQRIDRMTMLASVEGRVPFQDNRVVDLALSIGMNRKIMGKVKKVILVEAFRGEIPEIVIKRPKRPFAAPAMAWLHGALREYSTEVLNPQAVNQLGVLDGNSVGQLVNSYYNKGIPTSNLELIGIWNLLTLCIWIKKLGVTI